MLRQRLMQLDIDVALRTQIKYSSTSEARKRINMYTIYTWHTIGLGIPGRTLLW